MTQGKGLVRSHRSRVFFMCFLFIASIILYNPPSIDVSGATLSKVIPAGSTTALYNTVDQHTKYILYYTNYWNQPDFQFGTGRQPFLDNQCPVHNCWAQSTGDPSISKSFSDFDAVLFSVQAQDNFNLTDQGAAIQFWRKPQQRFVFFIMESQVYSIHNLRSMNRFFNWTMTFRWDSDIPRPYGWFQELSKDPFSFYPHKPDHWIQFDEQRFQESLPSRPKSFHDLARRPGKVAWIVSHCDTSSRREDYVYQLRKYIQVDEFGGKCQHWNSPTCDQPYSIESMDNCTRHVQQDYKFYLSFENQFCNDYVTEKFFQRMDHSVVITLGQANYSDIAPPHSSISVFDFETAHDLANYLLQLDQDDASYLSYFWWKDFYRVQHSRSAPRENGNGKRNGFGPSMCHLCEKLHMAEQPTKVYEDLYQWWRDSADCGKRLHGLKARMSRDAGLPGFRTISSGAAAERMSWLQKPSSTTGSTAASKVQNVSH